MFRTALHFQAYHCNEMDSECKNANSAKSFVLGSEPHRRLLPLDDLESAMGALQTDGVYSVPSLLSAVSAMASRNSSGIRSLKVFSAS